MNERIRAAWIKAAREDSDPDNWDTQEQFIERFAQLIVRDSIGMLIDYLEEVDKEQKTPSFNGLAATIVSIRERFGVK